MANMEQVKAIARLTFSEALRPFLDLRALLRAAEGKDSSAEIQGQPMVIARAEERHRVQLQVRALSIEQEASESGDLPPDRIITSLQALGGAVAFPSLSSARLDALWIDAYDLPFHELVSRMKTRLLAPTPLTAPGTDIAVTIDAMVNGQKIEHVQIGPMMPAQLNSQFLVFKRERLPDQFIFCATGWTLTPAAIEHLSDLEGNFAPFMEWARDRAEQVAQLIRE